MQFFSDNPALRAHIESQIDFMTEFTQKTFDALREISELNLRLARQTIEGSLHACRELTHITDPMQFTQVAMKQLEPAAERLRTYQQHLLSALAGAQADLTRTAESRMPEVSRRAGAAAEEMVRQAAAGTTIPVTAPRRQTPNGPATPSPMPGNGSAEGKPHSA